MAQLGCDLSDIKSAMHRIRPFVYSTPLLTSATLDKMTGHKILLKTENFQKTGSFKVRGATNAVLKLRETRPEVKSVVTNSSGNHGQALAYIAQQTGLDCYVVMTNNSPECKIESVKNYGAHVVLCEPSEKARRQGSDELRDKLGAAFVSSSQDYDVIAGQGTLALEMLAQNSDIEVIVAAIGGGGLIGGIATAVREMKPSVKVIGAEPELADDCYVSIKTGVLTPNPTFPDTIADGIRCSVGKIAWPIIRDLVDDVITVSEDEIKKATLLVWQRCKLVIEPSAGAAVAAVFSRKFKDAMSRLFEDKNPRNVAVVLCGGNIDFAVLPELFI